MDMLINGKLIDKPEKIEIRNPFNNKVIDRVPQGNHEDVKNALAAANRAKKTLNDLSSREISESLYGIHEELSKNSKSLAKLITLDCGKPIKDSIEEVNRSIQTILLSAEESKRIYGETIPMDACAGGENVIGFTMRLPLGVVAAITPFNYPLNLAIHKVAPAIAAKNSVVLKPSMKAPLTALKMAEIMDFYLPEGALNAVTGHGRTIGDEIVTSPVVNKISFTGSVEIGEHISKHAGMKKLTLELGGNDPLIVLEDADIEKAAEAAVRGSYLNAGQVCIGVKRVILDNKIADEFIQKFVSNTKKLVTGDPMDPETDVGPLINKGAAIEVENRVNESVNDGAELLCGGKRGGTLYMPTILDNVDSKMKIVQYETFGPVSPIIRINGIDEAVKVANNTKYGLQAGIFTNNINNAMKAVKEIEAGGIIVNKPSTYRMDNMPFGGCKMSGLGKEGIKYAIEDMTKTKIVVINPL
ncbi:MULTISPECIES: lactaldehyde dehydrogenase [Methanobacterium]|jgi:lactaldehyde dehydrogenase|uniref:Lactaldehyde dehydrogenase n=1 Tax=Methanobacterium bryantii TaxID=2161 RepID=A0A2A2H314_METBR|nr:MULTISPECIES: lactaldehyde dehydrogenase [Methanobacterium]OEC86445.1 lactaldehyde dehydrogenase [Methanobacterium sp. A39]PAV03676.1 lactaldehyde dehydrogenase [Methanobacterium bryantii]